MNLKSAAVSPLYSPRNEGTLPDKLPRTVLEKPARFRYTSDVRDEKEDGMVPDKQFPNSDKYARLDNSPRLPGRDPFNLFPDILRVWRDCINAR